MQRPAWTCCFFFLWILLIPGIILTHLSLCELIPHIPVLPQKIVEGFQVTFKLGSLPQASYMVEMTAAQALLKCGVNASSVCPTGDFPTYKPQNRTSNTTAEMDQILAVYQQTLATVQKVVNDVYFGISDLQPTADELNSIVYALSQLSDTGAEPCVNSTPVYCEIFLSSDAIVKSASNLTTILDKIENNDLVKTLTEHEGDLVVLHGLPYIMVLALASFTCFWCWPMCCCCLIPYALFWIAGFAINGIVFVLGCILQFFADKIHVPMLKNDPNLQEFIVHVQTEYAAFWDLVFVDLYQGARLLFIASVVFVVVGLLLALYSIGVCCCRPYRAKAECDERTPMSRRGTSEA